MDNTLHSLTTPTTLRTVIYSWHQTNYFTIYQTLRANVDIVIANWAYSITTQISDTCDCATGYAFYSMVWTKLVAAMVTTKFRFSLANRTIFRHAANPEIQLR